MELCNSSCRWQRQRFSLQTFTIFFLINAFINVYYDFFTFITSMICTIVRCAVKRVRVSPTIRSFPCEICPKQWTEKFRHGKCYSSTDDRHQLITLSIRLCVSHCGRDVARRADSFATAETGF